MYVLGFLTIKKNASLGKHVLSDINMASVDRLRSGSCCNTSACGVARLLTTESLSSSTLARVTQRWSCSQVASGITLGRLRRTAELR